MSRFPLPPTELHLVPRADASRMSGGSSAHLARKADRVVGPARRSRRPATNTIGVVVADATTGLFADPYYSALLRGISTVLASEQLLFMLMAPQSARELRATESVLAGRRVDGVIMVGLHIGSQLPALAQQRSIPAVLCGHPPREVEISSVDCDNRDGAALAVEHLLSLGRTRIAAISGNLDVQAAVDRRTGYRDALANAKISIDPTMEEVADFYPDRATMAMERLLLNHPDLDGVFVASDQMAVAAVGVLQQARKRIPEDVAVIGFDDSPYALATSPALSSIHQPFEETGSEAVRLLLREMAEPDETPRQIVLKTRLVVRASTVGGDIALAASR
jgi:DNA-binding LacI/PurR family transcriptional regulator